ILKRLLAPENSFQTGVDIGCGTGYSARALAPYCEHVYGVDPSQPMLSEAEPSATITYQLGAAENTSLPNGVANIITYAGSLFYADIALAVKELQRISQPGTLVLIYDFSIIFAPFIEAHQLTVNEEENNYNHRCNFTGISGFHNDAATVERLTFTANAAQLAHLLLSEPQLYSAYCKRYHTQKPFDLLKKTLLKESDAFAVEAEVFYTRYVL